VLPTAAQAAPETVVSLSFHEGFIDQYICARPLLNGPQPGRDVLRPHRRDRQGYACWQLDDLCRDGHEIGGMRVDLTDPAQD
jgi:hypothetical protein